MANPVPELRLDLEYYTVTDLAAAVGVSRSAIQARLQSGALNYDAEVVGRRCFSRSKAEEFARTYRDGRGRPAKVQS